MPYPIFLINKITIAFLKKYYIIKLILLLLGGNMEEILAKELTIYETNKNELIGKSKGKFVLIKDDQIIDVFDTKSDAIRQGYERFGNVPFLVKQIVEFDIPQNFTSNLIRV
jgi:hypothetical protein